MKYFKEISEMRTFNLNDATDVIGKSSIASKNLNSMVKKGYVHRVKQNLYTSVNFATGDDYANRFQIASKINSDSFISYHSAFEFYGFYNQIYFDVQVCSTKRFSNFTYNGCTYKSYQTTSLEQVKVVQGVRVVSLERAIIDSINMLGKVMDAEELVKCLNLINYLKEENLLKMLEIYDKEILYRKTGYILSYFQEDFSLSDEFFEICKNKGVLKNKGYLISDKDQLVFNKEWGLYAYKDLIKLVDKGGMEEV